LRDFAAEIWPFLAIQKCFLTLILFLNSGFEKSVKTFEGENCYEVAENALFGLQYDDATCLQKLVPFQNACCTLTAPEYGTCPVCESGKMLNFKNM
jgi:hypothetical protein